MFLKNGRTALEILRTVTLVGVLGGAAAVWAQAPAARETESAAAEAVPVVAGAPEAPDMPEAAAPVRRRKSQVTVEVGPELFSYRYEEPGLMEMTGFMLGVDGRLTIRFPLQTRRARVAVEAAEADPAAAPAIARPETWGVLRMDGRIAAGTTDYDGALQDGTPYTIDDIPNAALEMRGLAGAAFPRGRGETVLLAGLGTRYKTDDASDDPAGYIRESLYLYFPLLVEHTCRLANGNRLRVALEFDYLLAGEQTSDLSDAGGDEIVNDQNSGYGARASVAYTWVMRGMGLTLEPFVRYWNIDDSEVETRAFYVYNGGWRERIEASFVEPANETLEAGLSVKGSF